VTGSESGGLDDFGAGRCAVSLQSEIIASDKEEWMLRPVLIAALAIAFAPAAEQSGVVDATAMKWQPVEIPGVPKGMLQKTLRDDQRTKTMSSLIRFPKGFRDPKHYHTTCGHGVYILKGKLQTPTGVLAAGMFLYAGPKERHGPLVALEETDMLLYTDGPLDYHLAE
jgi:hypothetical protein